MPNGRTSFPTRRDFCAFVRRTLYLFARRAGCGDSLSPFNVGVISEIAKGPLRVSVSSLPVGQNVVAGHGGFVLKPDNDNGSFFAGRVMHRCCRRGTRILLISAKGDCLKLYRVVGQGARKRSKVCFACAARGPVTFGPFCIRSKMFSVRGGRDVGALVLAL